MTIHFYNAGEPYGALSNFSRYGFALDGYEWPTVEHYYQAQKFTAAPDFDAVRQARTAFQARRIGNDRSRAIHPDWDEIREAVMWRAICAKFDANPEARAKLLATGDEVLVEASPYDDFWGCGPRKDGQNRFGKMLMRLRSQLQEPVK